MPLRVSRAFVSQSGFERGFGLVELMITIAVMSVLAAIALPSYSYLLRGNRVSTQANDFLSAVKFARNESITRSRGVTLCAADTTATSVPASCGASTDWTKGWIVIIDDTPGSTVPPAFLEEMLLRTWVGNAQNTIVPDAAQTFIRFNPRGEARSNTAADVTFTLKPVQGCSNQQQRSILVTQLGRSGSTKVDCT